MGDAAEAKVLCGCCAGLGYLFDGAQCEGCNGRGYEGLDEDEDEDDEDEDDEE